MNYPVFKEGATIGRRQRDGQAILSFIAHKREKGQMDSVNVSGAC
ncbi:hypothetical protein [Paenibacillus sp. MZ04-78.2]|nr:hypothetical protein [Paenibacillus sp. MZ04-78.2]